MRTIQEQNRFRFALAGGQGLRYREVMLSVLFEAAEDPVALSVSLASLVPGAVDGLVREVIVIDRGMGEATRRVADHAGCRVIEGATPKAAVEAARGDWLLLLEPGARPVPGWIEAISGHLADPGEGRRRGQPGRLRVARSDRVSRFRRWFTRRPALAAGILVARAEALRLAAGAAELEDLAKAVRTIPIDAEIRLAADR